jgi:hypothetical protein
LFWYLDQLSTQLLENTLWQCARTGRKIVTPVHRLVGNSRWQSKLSHIG